jgi:hypothetical protein
MAGRDMRLDRPIKNPRPSPEPEGLPAAIVDDLQSEIPHAFDVWCADPED